MTTRGRFHLLFTGLLPLLCTACVGDSRPIGYDSIRNSELYIPRAQLESIVEGQLARDDVISRLGSPDAENVETHSIGYQRCVTSDGYTIAVVIVPLPVPTSRSEITSCQRAGLWFDDGQRAVAWKEARHSSDDGPYKSTLEEWIEVPERHTNRDSGQEDVVLKLRQF